MNVYDVVKKYTCISYLVKLIFVMLFSYNLFVVVSDVILRMTGQSRLTDFDFANDIAMFSSQMPEILQEMTCIV